VGISVLALGCHKRLLVPQGPGLLYVKRSPAARMHLANLAASGVADASLQPVFVEVVLRNGTARFELGNLALPQWHALDAALCLLESIGVGAFKRHVLDFAVPLIAHLDRLGIGLTGPRERAQRSHSLVLRLPGEGWTDQLASREA
jgi:cysteine desulfurase / selenocysteine lyase